MDAEGGERWKVLKDFLDASGAGPAGGRAGYVVVDAGVKRLVRRAR